MSSPSKDKKEKEKKAKKDVKVTAQDNMENPEELRDWLFFGTHCSTCGVPNAKIGGRLMQCGRCRGAFYCSSRCFNSDAARHAEFCGKGLGGDPQVMVLPGDDPVAMENIVLDQLRSSQEGRRKAKLLLEIEKKAKEGDTKEDNHGKENEKDKSKEDEEEEEELIHKLDTVEIHDDDKEAKHGEKPSAHQPEETAEGEQQRQQQEEEVDLRHAETIKNTFGWTKPDWVLNSPLKVTPKGKMLRQQQQEQEQQEQAAAIQS